MRDVIHFKRNFLFTVDIGDKRSRVIIRSISNSTKGAATLEQYKDKRTNKQKHSFAFCVCVNSKNMNTHKSPCRALDHIWIHMIMKTFFGGGGR